MGTDIHWVVEVKDPEQGKWVGLLCSTYTKCPAAERWYGFFAEFGIRGDGPTAITPRGLPPDMSDLSIYESSRDWDHSHSWLPLRDFQAAYGRALARHHQPGSADGMFGPWADFWSDYEYRVVFAFDS